MQDAPPLRRWVFSFDQRAAGWFAEMIKVAVISARVHTSLQPLCLFDGDQTPPIISWLERNGVDVVRARVPFRDELFSEEVLSANAGTPYHPEHAAGAFLRLVAPDYVEEDCFLYTDCDVMFCADPAPFFTRPRVLAACREAATGDGDSGPQQGFNSGVMVLNSGGFAGRRGEMIDLLRRNHFYFRRHQSFDQSMLNLLFRDDWEPLAEEMNWRPFQGLNSRAAILHFHGPKPHRIQAILDGQASEDEAPVMSRLVFEHRLKYDHYLGEYRGYLAAA
jgi:hypothetical protein